MTTRQTSVHFADKTLAGVPALLDDFQSLINDKETSDATFVIGLEEVEFYAHKLILWARCKNCRRLKHDFWQTGAQRSIVFQYPQFDPDIFSSVLIYIYTGKIILQDTTVFTVLAISRELGVVELQRNCEEHISGTLSSQNACAFYAAALQMERDTKDLMHTEDSFVSACVHFIERHAGECVKSEAWLELPKNAMIQLVQSDDFALEEEDVWRSVLVWAKYNAGVPLDKSQQSWNDHEKELIRHALSGIINHVKLLLIDSKVFAEEVEPTGAVPMEISLERYRSAAVPSKVSPDDDNRLKPRVSLKLFHGTEILTKDKVHFQRLLNSWCGDEKQTWHLLFRASRDGDSAETFHRLCDGHAPTIVIVQGTTGNICGGFSDIPWTSKTSPRGRYIASNKAFLFSLENNQGVPPTKFECTNKKFATLHHANYGPIFGAGADFLIAGTSKSGMESYSNMPHSYGGDNASCSIMMGDYNFNVKDYEVFTPQLL